MNPEPSPSSRGSQLWKIGSRRSPSGSLSAAACLILLQAWATAGPARADVAPETYFAQSPSAPDSTTVKMMSEEVTVELGPDTVRVAADFVMRNDGPDCRMAVGFPDAAMATIWSSRDGVERWGEPVLQDFRVTVGGRRASTRFEDWDHLRGRLSIRGWIVFDAAFPENEDVAIHVSYWVPPTETYRPDPPREQRFAYIFRSGALWSGCIESACLRVHLSPQVDPGQIVSVQPIAQLQWVDRRTLVGIWTHWEPDFDVEIHWNRLAWPALRAALRAELDTRGFIEARPDREEACIRRDLLACAVREDDCGEVLSQCDWLLGYQDQMQTSPEMLDCLLGWKQPDGLLEVQKANALRCLGRDEEAQAYIDSVVRPRLDQLECDRHEWAINWQRNRTHPNRYLDYRMAELENARVALGLSANSGAKGRGPE
jgi:hypothetical protein